ncbi:MAG: hypothetical protein KIT73_19150, partial [Burkholderiales bacterium]|nr:hypothetical protein [Burkholderiales bacterium]
MSIQRRRLLALIEYAQQSVQSRTRVVSNVADHGRFLLFDHQLGGVDGTQVDRQESARHGSAWLAVARPAAPELPPRPENAWLAPWLGVGEALLVAPRLAPEIAGSALIAAGTHRDGAQPPKSVAEMAMPVALPQATHTLATYPFLAEVETQFARYL